MRNTFEETKIEIAWRENLDNDMGTYRTKKFLFYCPKCKQKMEVKESDAEPMNGR